MPKVFYTENDIEDMVKSGVLTLEINDNVVLTDLAYEKARRLGLKLVSDKPDNPPAAPVRPYISQQGLFGSTPTASGTPVSAQVSAPPAAAPPAPGPATAPLSTSDLQARIRNAVQARLGSQVDPALLDTIIQRVLASTGVK